MDLKEIEQWGRKLLEREAKKRGVRDPGAYTQAELIRLILRHDYSARNLRGAAKLVFEVLDGAKDALRSPKQPGKRAFSWDRGTYERPQDAPFWHPDEEPPESVQGHGGVDLVAEANEREAERLRRAAQQGEAVAAGSPQDGAPSEVRPDAPASSAATASEPANVLPQRPTQSEQPAATGGELADAEAEAFADDTAAGYIRDERASSEPEHVILGPHPKNGLRLRWRVGESGIARARAVLGTPGELALRVVAVRVDASSVVHTEITDHGPVDRDGVLIAPAPSDATRHITSIGLRNADRFVSIAHASD